MSQQLLFPLEIALTKPDLEILRKVKEQLEHTGFLFEDFSEEKISISGIPVGLNNSNAGAVLEQLITDIRDDVPDAGFSLNDLLAKSMARAMAIKSGTSLNKEEREHLVNRLFACKEPTVSPDNTPVLITLDVTELEKRFM